jgi:predicted dehydrogenase
MSGNETYGFAILGAGMVAEYHRQAVLANVDRGAKLVAVGHYNPDRFDEIAEDFGVPCVSEEQLLSDPNVNVVCICTPSGQHAQQALAAARAGKHVLVEKPMALSLADADTMIAACQQSDVRLGVVLQRRAEPLFRRVYDAIQVGDLGDLTLAIVTIPYQRPQAYFDQADWRGTWALDGGGVLMNQGIHLVDLLVWFMGDPVEVTAYADTLHRDIEVEDTLGATLRFANGSIATITATTTASPGFPHRVEIFGTGGGIQIEGENVGRWALVDPAQSQVEPYETSVPADAGAGGDPRGIKPTGHIAIVRDFLTALATGTDPQIDGVQGRRSLATVLAIYQVAGLLAG